MTHTEEQIKAGLELMRLTGKALAEFERRLRADDPHAWFVVASRKVARMTAHTHPPNFGRTVSGCPRCAELSAGAQPVCGGAHRSGAALTVLSGSEGIRAHFASAKHLSGGCGVVCTFGEW